MMTEAESVEAMGGTLMWHPVQQVLAGRRLWAVNRMCGLEFLRAMPDKSIDLIFGSPPYEDKRWYGELKFKKKAQDWVDWLIPFFAEGRRVCKGLMALVVGHGKTEDWRWSGAPALLEADLIRAGFRLRNPPIFGRCGIAGSGQRDWMRADYERIVCLACNEAGPLPWSNNVSHGHPPKWGAGGEFSNRLPNGARRNQWGGSENGIGTRRPDGTIQTKGRPSHRRGNLKARAEDGEIKVQNYRPPTLANPGNLLHSADEAPGNVIFGRVGGGHMGHKAASKSEAAMPLWLAEFAVLSYCPPQGVVYDPFLGSGTTLHAAVECGRRGLGAEIRDGQVAVAVRRLEGVTPRLFIPSDDRKAKADAAKAAGHDRREEGQEDRGGPGLFGGSEVP